MSCLIWAGTLHARHPTCNRSCRIVQATRSGRQTVAQSEADEADTMEPTPTMWCKFPGMERSSGKLGKQCARMIERTLPQPHPRGETAGVAEALLG